jgi:hypothetical protein
MSMICAWCTKVLGAIAPLDDTRISHGICATCDATVRRQLAGLGEP